MITALAFVVAGFVQLEIDKGLTPIPDYGNQNSMMVINGFHDKKLGVSSDYWLDIEDNVNQTTSFDLDDDQWRTPTFDWVKDNLPGQLKLDFSFDVTEISHTENNPPIEKQKITSILCYDQKDEFDIPENVCIPVSLTISGLLINFSSVNCKNKTSLR